MHCSSQTSTLSQALSFSTFIACIFFLIASMSRTVLRTVTEEELRNRRELVGDCSLNLEKELDNPSKNSNQG